MSRQQTLINEIRTRLDELESILNPTTPPTPPVVPPPNFQLSDSILKMNGTVFKITSAQRIELCKFISITTEQQINIKRFVETIDKSRCGCYCLVKEIERREKFLTEGENLYYDEMKKKYYSQCRMPCIPNNNNNCNRHTDAPEIDVSRMKILTNSSFNLTVDSIIQAYCMSHLQNEEPVESSKKPVLIEAPVAVSPKQVQIDVPKKPAPIKAHAEVQKKPAPVKKNAVDPPKKPAPVEAPVVVPKLKENSDIESSSDSENESSSSSDSEVDMIVSKVSESLKPAPTEESGSEPEDSDDCMLDADEIHDEEGNTYYIDEAKSVIKLDEDGYGERLGMLKEFKSGNIFYKNKRWKIEYFPKK
jgi:hypothetical protein